MKKSVEGKSAVLPGVLEVEKGQRVPELDREVVASIRTLQGHPGFQYLLSKLRFQRAVLRERLGIRQKTMEDVIMLQSGMAWSGWLQSQLETAIGFQSTAPAPMSRSEQAIFEEVQSNLEVLK